MTSPYPGVDMKDELATLKALYPNLAPGELTLAKENLDRYLSLAWELFEDSRLAVSYESAPTSTDQNLAVGFKERSIPNKPNHLPKI